MSPPVAVLATLVLILVVPRRIPIWIAFFAACIALPLLCGIGFPESEPMWRAAVTSPDTLAFTAICFGVFVLSSVLTHGGHLAALCDFFAAAIPNRRVRAAVMPALVGLVPMPGGAVVSAPLIDRSLGDIPVASSDKNLINYWFRHVWEVSWPLYPAVLLAAEHLGRGDRRFFLAQAPLTLVLAVTGYFTILKPVAGHAPDRRAWPPLPLARGALPLLVLIVLPFVLRSGGPFVPVGAAIVVALATALDFGGLRKVPSDRRIYAMTALSFFVKVYGTLLIGVGGAADVLGPGTPLWIFTLAAPFLVGFATGASIPFVTVTFPSIAAIAVARNAAVWRESDVLPWLVLGYAGGFAGYLMSPVHTCLVLSTRYFDSRILAVYKRMAVPMLVFLMAAIGIFLATGGRFDL